MGAVSFCKTVLAPNAQEGYAILFDEAVYNRGAGNRYSGDVNTTSIGYLQKSFPVYSKAVEKEAYEYIRNHDNGSKRTADYIDMGVKHYVLRQVSVTPKKNDAKYKYQYVLRDSSGIVRAVGKCAYDGYSEALEQGILHSLNVGDDVDVIVEPIKQSGSNVRATIQITETIVEKPPRRKLTKREKLIPMHVFCFYGWAAE